MLIVGVILLLAGSGSLIYGITQNNSGSAQLKSIMSSGSVNPGTVFIVIGAIAAVVGLVLVIIGAMSYMQTQSMRQTNVDGKPNPNTELNGWVCPKCSQINSMLFTTCSCGTDRPQRIKTPSQTSQWQCPVCGKINSNYVGTCGCGQIKP